MAKNLKTAADRVENDQPLVSEDTDSESSPNSEAGDDAAESAGSGDSDGRPAGGTGDGDKADPSAYLEDPPDLNFGDVGGMTDLKEALKEQVIDPLERPELYEEYNLGVVNGVLLYGPPGTGKTYITEALAGELDYS